jgi:predicted O-methyltransferase YrrM
VKVATRRPNRSSEIYRSAWYADPVRLRRASVDELFPSVRDVDVSLVGPLNESPGNVWLNELVVLAGICRCMRPKQVFELGTFNGRTTVNMAANTPDDCVIHTLDIPHDHPVYAMAPREDRFMLAAANGALYRNSPFAGKVRQLWADSAEFDPAPLAGQIDLAFIDGSHSYDYVENDTRKVATMMAAGGVVLWHDYYPQYPDVARFLENHRDKLVHIDATSLVVLPPGERL